MFHLMIDYPNLDYRYIVMPSAKFNESSIMPYNFTSAEL